MLRQRRLSPSLLQILDGSELEADKPLVTRAIELDTIPGALPIDRRDKLTELLTHLSIAQFEAGRKGYGASCVTLPRRSSICS